MRPISSWIHRLRPADAASHVSPRRVALNSLETALQLITHRLAPADRTTPLSAAEKHELMGALKGTLSLRYDRTGDARYDMISALHKALRGSDGGAALYWLARMLTAGASTPSCPVQPSSAAPLD